MRGLSCEEDCTLYTQDISQKSNEFLRLNLILNNLVHSLDNVVHGNTLLNPAHLNREGNKLAQFDYIVSNPPFKTDFSDYRDKLEDDKYSDRFFAGVPKIPNTKKDSMAIYLMFIQHILFSLKEDGKAAIVVPTGFLTAQSGIEKRIREYIVDNNWLDGTISMPSNIFATTGTNVSILFIDKSKKDNNVFLVDASSIGQKIKDGKNQRTILNKEEIEKIKNTFINKVIEEEFSIIVDTNRICKKNYSLSAGQYFEIKIDCEKMTPDEFNNYIMNKSHNLNTLFNEAISLQDKILEIIKELK